MITALTFTNDSLGLLAGSSTGDLWFWQSGGLAVGRKLTMVQGAHDMGIMSMDSNGYQSATCKYLKLSFLSIESSNLLFLIVSSIMIHNW